MATHETHKAQDTGKARTQSFDLSRKTKNVETALADRALARLMREINAQNAGA